MAATQKVQVAILGGGSGALAAAFELTRPENSDRFAVTVYQQGWRLGGKCASGRDPSPGKAQRILEHGLHSLMGFYHDAFRVIRACYAEWKPAAGSAFAAFEDAFDKQNRVTFQEQVDGEWKSWNVTLAARDGLPGDPEPPTPIEILQSFVALLERTHTRMTINRKRSRLRPLLHWLHGSKNAFGAVWNRVANSHPTHKALRLTRGLKKGPTAGNAGTLFRIVELIERSALEMKHIADATETAIRRDALLLRLGYATLRGLIVDVLLHGDDFSRINDVDFRQWLISHGARPDDVQSAPIKGLYDLGFAYVDGDATDPVKAQAAAGVALYVSLQIMFGCRGAFLWKMKAGTADILFSPLYEVLRARGVTFKFFHRVDDLVLSEDKTQIESIVLTEQVNVSDGAYRPLIKVPCRGGKHVLAWPSEPLWDQIKDGAGIAKRLNDQGLSLESFQCEQRAGLPLRLTRGRDFDLVILGIPIGSFPYICKELIAARQAWREMVDGILTVQTQSLQLWMRPTLAELGWSPPEPTVSISYVEPYDSWGEMSQLLDAEPWPEGKRPGSVQYFCGAMSTPKGSIRDQPVTFPAEQLRIAETSANTMLDTTMTHLWPRAVDAAGKLDRTQVLSQYVRANVDPCERYVLSVPGSISLRLPPDCSTFANLYLAGDWVEGRVNSGSVEAAMSAGVRAAQAIGKLGASRFDLTNGAVSDPLPATFAFAGLGDEAGGTLKGGPRALDGSSRRDRAASARGSLQRSRR